MQITYGSVVELKYKLYAEDEDSQEISEQYLKIIYGNEPIPRNLEKELFGKEKDSRFSIFIPPAEAFGDYDKNLVNKVPISNLRYPERVKLNHYYQEETPYGREITFKVLEIGDDYVLADFNHPLAGKKMILEGVIIDVRKPSVVELMQHNHHYGFRKGG